MSFEIKQPVEVFVMDLLMLKQFQQVIDNWPIKIEVIHQTVVRHLQDLGFYFVEPFSQKQILTWQVLSILKNSPVLVDLIDKAKRQAILAATRGRGSIER